MTLQTLISRRLLYLLLTTTTLFGIYIYYPHAEAHWMIWSGLILSLVILGVTFKQRMLYLCVTALASLFLIGLAHFARFDAVTFALYLFLVTCICVYASEIYPRFASSFFVINLFAILAGCFPVANDETSVRLMYVMIGFAAALILQLLFWPAFVRFESRALSRIALQRLQKLNQEIFSCFLQPDYSESKYIYERRLHNQKIKFMAAVLGISNEEVATHLNALFANMLDYAQLRGRVTDYTIFQVCSMELTAILDEMNKLFLMKLKNSQGFDVSALLNNIERLEENYQNVLKVTAKEPLSFALFITSLRTFAYAVIENCHPERSEGSV